MGDGESFDAAFASFNEVDDAQIRWPSKKTISAVALTGGAGLLVYALKDKIQKFIRWGESVEQTSQNSADLLVAKINLAKQLTGVQDWTGVLESLVMAKKEACKLSQINQEFETRLTAFSNMPGQRVN